MAFLLYQWWRDCVIWAIYSRPGNCSFYILPSSAHLMLSSVCQATSGKTNSPHLYSTHHIQYSLISCSFCSGTVQITMGLMPVFPCDWTDTRFHVKQWSVEAKCPSCTSGIACSGVSSRETELKKPQYPAAWYLQVTAVMDECSTGSFFFFHLMFNEDNFQFPVFLWDALL